MVALNFEPALTFTRFEEGGNSNDKQDHGGRTSRGILQREWDEYRVSHTDLPQDVFEAPDSSISAIYHDQFWEPYCDKLVSGVDLAFFDFGVNAGQREASLCLQRALGVRADGHIGMQTLVAIDTHSDVDTLIHDFCERRRKFYRGLRQFRRYGGDWIGRADRCERAAIKISKPLLQPIPLTRPSPRANSNDKSLWRGFCRRS